MADAGVKEEFLEGKANPCGMTPTICDVCPFNSTAISRTRDDRQTRLQKLITQQHLVSIGFIGAEGSAQHSGTTHRPEIS